MSLFSNLHTSASGLNVSTTRLSVIGDNIANVNTIGYKASRASFSDFLPRTVLGMAGPTALGTGAGTMTVVTQFAQGSIVGTSNATDMAIDGEGFFVVREGIESYYTRNGEMYLDENGALVTGEGLFLQGYAAEDDVLKGTVSDLSIDTSAIPPRETAGMDLTVNLDADQSASNSIRTAATTGGTISLTGAVGSTTIDDLASAADFATSATVYDTLGTSHEVVLAFERESGTAWRYYAVTDGSEVTATVAGAAVTTTSDAAFLLATGLLTFDSNGELVSYTQSNVSSGLATASIAGFGSTAGASTSWNFTDAASGDIEFDFGLITGSSSTTATESEGQARMVSGASAATGIVQDGYGSGTLDSLRVQDDGEILGRFSNGQDLTMGKIVLALFNSDTGLTRRGQYLYSASAFSGEATLGVAGEGGRGEMTSFALENSNVELEAEFVTMIETERSFQANSRVMSTTDDALEELMRLV